MDLTLELCLPLLLEEYRVGQIPRSVADHKGRFAKKHGHHCDLAETAHGWLRYPLFDRQKEEGAPRYPDQEKASQVSKGRADRWIVGVA